MHDAFDPPFNPLQFHVHFAGFALAATVAVPVAHCPATGAANEPTLFAAPHVPFTIFPAEQDALVPPYKPLQFHVNVVPVSVTAVSVPVPHRAAPDAGAVVVVVPCAVPHVPLMGHAALASVQDAFVPPPEPLQSHVWLPPHEPAT